jgi:O-antigen/teichoic acid export membrane protein
MNLASIWRRLQKHSDFAANAALSAATSISLGGLSLAAGILAARLLGPQGRGELAAIRTYPTLFGFMAMLGTGAAVVYYSARDPARAGRYFGCALVISLLSCVPVTVCFYVLMPLLLKAQSPQIVAAARWYLMAVPITALSLLCLFALRGRSKFVPWNVLRVAPVLAWLGILVVCWINGVKDPRQLAAAYLAATAALLIPTIFMVRKNIQGSFAPDPREFKPMLAYGLPCIASGVPRLLNLGLDQMLMAALLPAGPLGLYVAAVAWSSAINPLMNSIGAVLFPSVAAGEAHDDRVRSFSRGSRLAALMALITTPILAAATPWGLTLLFGTSFRGAILPALILVPAGGIFALNAVIEDGIRGLGKPAACLYAEAAGVLTTIISLYFLLRPMGITGAAIASLLGYSTVMATLLLQARRLTGESPGALLFPTRTEIYSGTKQLVILARRMAPVISRA